MITRTDHHQIWKDGVMISEDVVQTDITNEVLNANLITSISALRNWANTARSTTVTSANAVAVLGVVVNNLAQFYDGFADLLTLQYAPHP